MESIEVIKKRHKDSDNENSYKNGELEHVIIPWSINEFYFSKLKWTGNNKNKGEQQGMMQHDVRLSKTKLNTTFRSPFPGSTLWWSPTKEQNLTTGAIIKRTIFNLSEHLMSRYLWTFLLFDILFLCFIYRYNNIRVICCLHFCVVSRSL
jgi:hypothetical protein